MFGDMRKSVLKFQVRPVAGERMRMDMGGTTGTEMIGSSDP